MMYALVRAIDEGITDIGPNIGKGEKLVSEY